MPVQCTCEQCGAPFAATAYNRRKGWQRYCSYACKGLASRRGTDYVRSKPSMNEHRILWIAAYGPIPPGYVVHHINGNRRDNRLENLQLLTNSDHGRLHNPKGVVSRKRSDGYPTPTEKMPESAEHTNRGAVGRQEPPNRDRDRDTQRGEDGAEQHAGQGRDDRDHDRENNPADHDGAGSVGFAGLAGFAVIGAGLGGSGVVVSGSGRTSCTENPVSPTGAATNADGSLE